MIDPSSVYLILNLSPAKICKICSTLLIINNKKFKKRRKVVTNRKVKRVEFNASKPDRSSRKRVRIITVYRETQITIQFPYRAGKVVLGEEKQSTTPPAQATHLCTSFINISSITPQPQCALTCTLLLLLLLLLEKWFPFVRERAHS